jgi:hypothetical protein
MEAVLGVLPIGYTHSSAGAYAVDVRQMAADYGFREVVLNTRSAIPSDYRCEVSLTKKWGKPKQKGGRMQIYCL